LKLFQKPFLKGWETRQAAPDLIPGPPMFPKKDSTEMPGLVRERGKKTRSTDHGYRRWEACLLARAAQKGSLDEKCDVEHPEKNTQ